MIEIHNYHVEPKHMPSGLWDGPGWYIVDEYGFHGPYPSFTSALNILG